MEEIFRGESLYIVLRCRDRNGNPEDMSGKKVDVMLFDAEGNMCFGFSNYDENWAKITVEGNYLLCPIAYESMRDVRGVYMLEIRVKEGDCVRIAQVPGVRVLDSETGKLEVFYDGSKA
ncbi:MAG: hypothetical protein NC410_08950 [Oscillibacter sp.]|nr:hypothetical protein [Oscillibacter sp.]